MSKYDFDLFVIGGGSGGVRGARVSAQMGARVAIAELNGFGGTCVMRGCIPKKLLVYASGFPEEFEDAQGYGWTIDAARFDWASLIANKDEEIERISRVYRNVLEQAGVAIFRERAVVKNAHTIHLADSNRDVTAETLLVATGGYPSRQTGAEGAECCITSDDAFHLKTLPNHIVIVGGGYIALEFAHIFHGLGAQVTLVYRGTKILRGFDEDLRDQLQASLQSRGIRLLLETGFRRCVRTATGITAVTLNGDEIEADHVMLAIGRLPSTYGLGLENAGVKLRPSGRVEVDAWSRSSVPNIYAIGDVTGRIELTPVAIHEAMCFAKTVYGGQPTAPDHELVPTAVFTRPEIGTVGMSEERALARGYTIDIYKTSFRPLKNTLSGRTERMMMKLVVCAKTRQVLGCHIFGPDAGEMIQLVAIALKLGATKDQFDATIAVHPTMAEELVTLRTKTATRTSKF
ncbi:MAG: glutathione-disulfide reductase [Alphaproteobacteria bacterium]|nr:glutathione-disulfide reductase [Alphaproteobacteria bacterium]